jgi:ribonuclease HI
MRYRLYTDGSSHARGGKPGGWAWILVRVEDGNAVPVRCQSGGDAETSNNRMELSAVMMGLGMVASGGGDFMYPGDHLEVVSDSQYALNMAAGNWNATSNVDLIKAIWDERDRLIKGGITVTFSWVRGHNGEPWNERVDSLATRAKARIVEGLKDAG